MRQEAPETETILMALDQISQTIDVMTSVVVGCELRAEQ